MEPSKEAIAVRLARLNRQLLGKISSSTLGKKNLDREILLDALIVLYDECNDDVKKSDELVRSFLDKYRSALAELRCTRVCYADFEVLQLIGRGHFGDVHMVREKHTGDVYALKTLRKDTALTQRGVACYEEERDILASGASAWLVRLQYAFQSSSHLYLVMEFCAGGDLAALLLRRERPLSERDAAFYVAEVAHALQALHALGYVHRDIKPHNILLDRCGHVKLTDFGSAAKLSEGVGHSRALVPVGTPDYVAPELLAAVETPHRHSSSCDYWSLGVVAFELVTLRRPFSSGDESSLKDTLSNLQRYEHSRSPELPFESLPAPPSEEWRSLVKGLLKVDPAKRFHYLDTLQHFALRHLSPHCIRDQAPPWVPKVRGAEDASYFTPVMHEKIQPSPHAFRKRAPFAGRLPFIGYSYVPPEETEDTASAFTGSHDTTAIDLATYKSAEKLAAIRGREVAALQSKVAAMETDLNAATQTARRVADAEAEEQRAKLQKEITELVVQNRRLTRQLEVEHEERRAQERAGLELVAAAKARQSSEISSIRDRIAQIEGERNSLKDEVQRLRTRVSELQIDCDRAHADAAAARNLHAHYKDSMAKERALRRQTMGGANESREIATRLASAEANAAREERARNEAERRLSSADQAAEQLRAELRDLRQDLGQAEEMCAEKQRACTVLEATLNETKIQLAEERGRSSALLIQIQELQLKVQEYGAREVQMEQQYARTEARLMQRATEAEARAASALQSDARHREKVNALEQLVRQLEREVSAMEASGITQTAAEPKSPSGVVAMSDTESVGESEIHSERAGGDVGNDVAVQAQLRLLKEQLERAEAQLQARTEEITTLRQETRAANLAKWRKERELNDLTSEARSTARDLKRLEERLSVATENRKELEKRLANSDGELATLRPKLEGLNNEHTRLKEQHEILQRKHETAQAEVDRSRNDIRKLKSELQYSENRRLRAESEAETASRERTQLHGEVTSLRGQIQELTLNNKALQEACGLLEEQLSDLERLSDIHEVKSKELQSETLRMREELEACRTKLTNAERAAGEGQTAAAIATKQHEEARELVQHTHCQLALLRERLESREDRIAELEARAATLDGEKEAAEVQLAAAARRLRDLQEECALLRTRAHDHHAHAMQLQAQLAEAQEEVVAAREAAEASAAWWRTRETKADATIRQQTKLIDFLQAKMEENGRKKCSLSNKLFGRSGRRTAGSPPLRRVNRELREEVEQLRARLATYNHTPLEQTPKLKKQPALACVSIDTPDAVHDSSLQLAWSNEREKVRARADDGVLVCSRLQGGEIRAHLVSPQAPFSTSLPKDEAVCAFTVKLDGSEWRGTEAAAICGSADERTRWLARLRSPKFGYQPREVTRVSEQPDCSLLIAPMTLALGCSNGLRSLRGEVKLRSNDGKECIGRVQDICNIANSGQVVLLVSGILYHLGLMAFSSALRRAPNLKPTLQVQAIQLPESQKAQLLQVMSGESSDNICIAVSCGRRIFLIRWDAPSGSFEVTRTLTLERTPTALLLTGKSLFIAMGTLLKTSLILGGPELFASTDPTVAAATRKHSQPKNLILIKEKPVEILICYPECGVFVDENGTRTRSEDAKWLHKPESWSYCAPFLYTICQNNVSVYNINEEAYKAPPCTCDSNSLASTVSDCAVPDVCTVTLNEPTLLGQTPLGILISSRCGDEYKVLLIEGATALRSVGASVESLVSLTEAEPVRSDQEVDIKKKQSPMEVTPSFLADIRKRAAQLRKRNSRENSRGDEVIRSILNNEVGAKKVGGYLGRRSPASVSEFSSDSESDPKTDSAPSTTELCAEMFTRQVRFQ